MKLKVSLVCFVGDHDQTSTEEAMLGALAKIPGVEMVRVDSREEPKGKAEGTDVSGGEEVGP